jgi:hypothetical protein
MIFWRLIGELTARFSGSVTDWLNGRLPSIQAEVFG